MFEKIKKDLYFKKTHLLIRKGLSEGTIIPFDDDFYDQLSHTYFNCLPVSINIKYLKPILSPGKCDSRSLYMFFCFDDALLVRGDKFNLELMYGKENAGHGWIEIGDYVYDPTMLVRFDRDFYYQMFSPTNVSKATKDDYVSVNEDFYNESLKENADYVTIMLGTNDSKSGIWNKENFKVEAKDFIESYINMESNPKVYVMLPPRIYIDGSNGNCNNETLVNEVIPILKEVSSSLNVEVIDIYSVTDNHEDYFSDGLHPNFEGNKIISKEIAKTIKK